jgi:hypothetical protein
MHFAVSILWLTSPDNAIAFSKLTTHGRSKMKTLMAALALVSLAAGPVFAQTVIQPQVPQSSYYGADPNSPALTGGGSLGHNWLQQRF